MMSRRNLYVAFAVVSFTLVLVAVFSKKSVRAEIVIYSDPQTIWRVLMDTPGYRNWNPVLIPVSGDIAVGATMRYKWHQPGNQTIEIDSKVIEVVEGQLLHQRGGTPGILTFDHRYQLFPVNGGTRVVQSEVYRGIGVWFWDADQMEPEYGKVNKALKTRVSESASGNT